MSYFITRMANTAFSIRTISVYVHGEGGVLVLEAVKLVNSLQRISWRRHVLAQYIILSLLKTDATHKCASSFIIFSMGIHLPAAPSYSKGVLK